MAKLILSKIFVVVRERIFPINDKIERNLKTCQLSSVTINKTPRVVKSSLLNFLRTPLRDCLVINTFIRVFFFMLILISRGVVSSHFLVRVITRYFLILFINLLILFLILIVNLPVEWVLVFMHLCSIFPFITNY